MIKALDVFVPKVQLSKFFQIPNFKKINLIKSIPDEIIIKNKPAAKNAGLFFTPENLKKNLLSTNLDKIEISVNQNNKISIPKSLHWRIQEASETLLISSSKTSVGVL